MPNSFQADPTRTTTLRRQFIVEMRRKFNALKQEIIKIILEEDAFGLIEQEHRISKVFNTRWKFLTDSNKLKAFRDWLLSQVKAKILSVDENTGQPWLAKYISSAYKRGVIRAYIDAKIETATAQGERFEGFLEHSFNSPERTSKIELLATRAFEQLKGVTDTMAQNMNRVLAEEMSKGTGIRSVTKRLTKEVDNISKARAERIARTEIINAHAEGQLDAFEEAGVREVNVMAEWITAAGAGATPEQMQKAGVCKLCAALSGVVMTVKEARGLLPRHPNCRCAWLPANVGERDKKQKTTKTSIEKSIERSVKAETGEKSADAAKRASSWQGADRKVKTKQLKPPLKVKERRKPKAKKVRASFGKTFSKPLWSD
jgi:hypothetical protein